MNLQEIKEAVNSGLPNEYIERIIIKILSKDENVIPLMMEIIEIERAAKKELTTEMNLLLSKAHVGLDEKKFNKDNFMQKEIIAFYKKYEGVVGHCFKNMDKLPE